MTTRIRLLVAMSVLLLMAAACGDETTPADGDTANGGGEDLGLLEEGTLLVGSDLDFAPFEFIEDGEERGFDVDIMMEIGERLGLEIQYVNASFDTIFSQLASGEFDAIMSAITITAERAELIAFSDPYFEATQALVVTSDSPVAGVDDLGGQDVGAQQGTTGLDYARANFTESSIVEFPSYPAAFTALESDQLDAVLADLPAALEAVERSSEGLAVAEEIDTEEQYGIGVQQDNEALLDAINGALEEIMADGIYAEIFEEWFPGGEVPEQFQS